MLGREHLRTPVLLLRDYLSLYSLLFFPSLCRYLKKGEKNRMALTQARAFNMSRSVSYFGPTYQFIKGFSIRITSVCL